MLHSLSLLNDGLTNALCLLLIVLNLEVSDTTGDAI